MLLFLCSLQINAQSITQKCGTDEQMELLYRANPASKAERLQLYEIMKTNNLERFNGPTDSYTIPVVFHVFGTEFNSGSTVTDAIIQDALDKTNEDFQGLNSDYTTINAPFDVIKQPLDITFKLAQLDPSGNPTTGVIYHEEAGGMGNYSSPIVPQVAWDNSMYMNVYITRDLYDDGDYYNSGVAWYPDTFMTNNNLARVVYNGSYLGSNTNENFRSVLTHEFGHFLDLPHTFAGYVCSNDPNDGDGIADTPSQDNHSAGTSCNVIYNCFSVEINNENFMDYTDCYKMFTQGQVSKMANALDDSAARNTLWTVPNLIATGLNGNLGARITTSSNTFEERYLNDGVIETVFDLTCQDCTFTNSSGDLVVNTDYTVTNVPSGLTMRISATSSTTAQVFLEGTALDHLSSDSVSNLNINFLDPMVTGGVSQLYSDSLANLSVSFNDVYTEYCTPSVSYSGYTYISNVEFNGASNPTVNDYISDYTENFLYPVRQATTYPISITTNKGNGGINDNLRIQVWFDWNNNFVYEDSELELTESYSNSQTDANGDYTFTSSIAIPANATIGNTAFRVIAHYVYNGGGDTPCNTIDSGESEDYGLNIVDENATFTMDFSGAPNVVNFSDPVSFLDLTLTDSGDSIVSWLWTFEGGQPATSTDSSPTNIIFPEAGTFDVTLQVITANGTDQTLTKPDYITSQLDYCDTWPNYGSYFSINHVTLETIDHSPSLSNYYDYYDTESTNVATGEVYPITITAELGNGGTSDVNRVRVWADWNFDSMFSEDELMISKNVNGSDYDANGEFTFTENISVPFDAAVGKKVGLRIIGHYVDGYGGETACGSFDSGNALDYGLNITQGADGITAFATTNSNEFSFTDTVTFIDQSSSTATITSWEWTFTGGTPSTFSGQTPPAISYSAPGIYNYTLTVTDSNNNTDTFNNSVEAIIDYCDTSPNYGTYFNVNHVTLETINHTPELDNNYNYYNLVNTDLATGDTYAITINTQQGNGGASDVNRVRVWIDWNFDGVFAQDELMVSKNVYNADYTNGEFEVAENITVPIDASIGNKVGMRIIGHYVDGSGGETACGAFDSGNALDYGINIVEALSVHDETAITAIIYPNPASSELYIKTLSNGDINIEIFNMLGQRVLQDTHKLNNNTAKVDISKLVDGVYYVFGKQGNKRFTKKIIIKK